MHAKTLRRLISAQIINPLSDLKSRSIRLATLKELRRTQWLPRQELLNRQRERLRDILVYAGKRSPYYRRLFAANGFDPVTGSLTEFAMLPLLEKQTVLADVDNLLVDGSVKASLVMAKTGGSTGQAVTVYFDTPWQQRRNADAMRADEWAGWRLGMQTAAVWGNPPAPVGWYTRFKRRWLYCQDLYLDTMNISPATMDQFVSEWKRRTIDILFGHAHSLFILADYLKDQPDHGVKPRDIIATSMMLLQHERGVIEKIFGCPVTNRYGCEEVALIACECECHNGMHLNIEHLYVEFLNESRQQANPGETADIVVTDLYNKAMPMIRYRVGDVGVYSNRICECGRGHPMLENVVGRTADFLKREDGSRVAGISLVERTLTAIPGIAQLQLVQTDISRIEANIVKAQAFTDMSGEQLIAELKSVFGEYLHVQLQYFEQIPREANGKYRFSKCLV